MTDRRTFVSYAREDEEFARRLATDLQIAGVNVWLDVLSIGPGTHWDREVEDALRESEAVLLILSPDAIASRSVMDECSFALDADKRVIPLLYRDCAIPLRLTRLQRIDFSRSYEDGLAKLVVALGSDAPSRSTSTPRIRDRKRVAMAASALLGIAIIISTVVFIRQKHAPNAATTTGTPDFTERQTHLDRAPAGLDANYAWIFPGGGGARVTVMIITGASSYAHEDLPTPVLLGELADDDGWRYHTMAIHGLIAAKMNAIGVTGFAPQATVIFNSTMGSPITPAIIEAADRLKMGDILLILFGRSRGGGKPQMLPLDWWPDEFAAIRSAVRRGVIVVEPAGNDALDLDDPGLDVPDAGFPAGWRNPFRGAADSGAILVGAGGPSDALRAAFSNYRTRSDTYTGKPPSALRATFSNYGSRVDVHAPGIDVITTGFGDLFGEEDAARSYTAHFDGTSAAATMVAGALACVQGVLLSKGLEPLNPAEARRLLRETGTPRAPSARIGPQPDLRRLIPAALALRR